MLSGPRENQCQYCFCRKCQRSLSFSLNLSTLQKIFIKNVSKSGAKIQPFSEMASQKLTFFENDSVFLPLDGRETMLDQVVVGAREVVRAKETAPVG